jgi:hypothetical protein
MYSEQAIQKQRFIIGSMLERNPDEWITGTERMTSEQTSYLQKLTNDAGEVFDGNLSKASAAEHIKRLEQKLNK